MGRFETTGQIVTLFAGAGCVGVFLIVLLTAEANKRQATLDRSDEMIVAETGDMTELKGIKYVWNKIKNSIRFFSGSGQESEKDTKSRRKREVSPDYYSNHVIEGEYDDIIESFEEEEQNVFIKKQYVNKKSLDSVTADLGSALLSSSLTGHKIRHIEQKLSLLGRNSQLVTAVLDMFCAKEETVLYVMCLNSNNSTEKEKNKVDIQHDVVQNKTETGGTNKTAEQVKNYKDHISSYVNVMRNRLAPHVLGMDGSNNVCSSPTEFIVVVVLTSFVNFFLFVLISIFCRLSQKVKYSTLDDEGNENLVAGDDDLTDIDDGAGVGRKQKNKNLHVNIVNDWYQ